MAHYRSMYEDNGMLYACHLDGKDVTLTIKKVEGGVITGAKGKKDKKPILHFERTDKRLGLNKTNGKVIAQLYGTEVNEWVGKRVTLFATTTDYGGETVECIRVRNRVPAEQRGKSSSSDPAPLEPTPEPAPEGGAA